MPDQDAPAKTLSPLRGPIVFGDTAQVPAGVALEASLPAAPELPPAVQRAMLEREERLVQGEASERHSTLRGLLLIAVLVLVFSLVRAGAERAFPAGWLR